MLINSHNWINSLGIIRTGGYNNCLDIFFGSQAYVFAYLHCVLLYIHSTSCINKIISRCWVVMSCHQFDWTTRINKMLINVRIHNNKQKYKTKILLSICIRPFFRHVSHYLITYYLPSGRKFLFPNSYFYQKDIFRTFRCCILDKERDLLFLMLSILCQ